MGFGNVIGAGHPWPLSLRGLSKICLIFDWGSVLKKIRHSLSHKNRLRRADSCASSLKEGAEGGCAAVRPSGAVAPEGRTNPHPKQLDKLQFASSAQKNPPRVIRGGF